MQRKSSKENAIRINHLPILRTDNVKIIVVVDQIINEYLGWEYKYSSIGLFY